jgi:hypothetical protein
MSIKASQDPTSYLVMRPVIEAQRKLDRSTDFHKRTLHLAKGLQSSQSKIDLLDYTKLRKEANRYSKEISRLSSSTLKGITAFKKAGGDMDNLANGVYPKDRRAQREFVAKFSEIS